MNGGSLKDFAQRHPYVVFALIFVIGMIPRLIMMPTAGFALDLEQHYHWAQCGDQFGVFGIYQCDVGVTHPPISPVFLWAELGALRLLGGDTSTFTDNAPVIAVLKLHNLLFESALIGLLFYIAYKKAGVWWAALVTAALYWNPGWSVVTAYWGQNDSTYSFFMLLVGYLLVRKQPRWMWIAYGFAWLAKFQSVMFLPVLAVLSLRRFGWRATLTGGVIAVAIVGVVVLPFYLGSGSAALRPFGGTVSLFPYISSGAHNFWFWVTGASPIALPDNVIAFAGLTYFQLGILCLTVGTALLCLRAWLQGQDGDEYLLLAAANLFFYMLPTQIQVRYLYPGLMFLALAMIKDWRLIALYVAASLAFTHNVFVTIWLGIGMLFYPAKLLFWQPVHDGIIMTVVFVAFVGILFRPLARRDTAPAYEYAGSGNDGEG